MQAAWNAVNCSYSAQRKRNVSSVTCAASVANVEPRRLRFQASRWPGGRRRGRMCSLSLPAAAAFERSFESVETPGLNALFFYPAEKGYELIPGSTWRF